MPTPKLIGRLTREASSEPRTLPSRGRRLPEDLLRQATRRVGIMALVAATLWTLAPLLGHLALYLTEPGDIRWAQFSRVDAIALSCVITSILLYVYLRTGQRNPEFVMDLALGYMVAMCFGYGVLVHWAQSWLTPIDVEPMITWTGPIILITAGIVPVNPRRMLVAGLVAASMDSIGMIVAQATGPYEFGPLRNAFLMHYPNYLMLGAAVVISAVVTRLGQQVSREREMGSYRLGEVLGRGGMGEVYRASHRMLARPAAIKLIRAEVLASSDDTLTQTAVARFRREAEAAAKLRSPHTVELYDFGVTEEGTLYLVMELLEGLNLEHLVRRDGPLSPSRVIHILGTGVRVASGSALARAGAPRHQAGQHPSRPGRPAGRLREGARLRPGALHHRAERGVAEQCGGDGGRNAGLYGAGDGARPPGGRTRRPLFAGLRRVLPAHRPPGLRGRHAAPDHSPASAEHARAAVAADPRAIPEELEALVLECLAKQPEDRPSSAADVSRRLAEIPLSVG